MRWCCGERGKQFIRTYDTHCWREWTFYGSKRVPVYYHQPFTIVLGIWGSYLPSAACKVATALELASTLTTGATTTLKHSLSLERGHSRERTKLLASCAFNRTGRRVVSTIVCVRQHSISYNVLLRYPLPTNFLNHVQAPYS